VSIETLSILMLTDFHHSLTYLIVTQIFLFFSLIFLELKFASVKIAEILAYLIICFTV